MRPAIVPDHNDRPAQVAKQVTQEPADIGLPNVVSLEPAIQPQPPPRGTDRHGGDGRYPVVFIAITNDRRLPSRPPGSTDRRDQEVAGFVDKGDMGDQPRRVFFMRGQSRRFQASIADSSRCVARFSGFWQLQFRACRSFPT